MDVQKQNSVLKANINARFNLKKFFTVTCTMSYSSAYFASDSSLSNNSKFHYRGPLNFKTFIDEKFTLIFSNDILLSNMHFKVWYRFVKLAVIGDLCLIKISIMDYFKKTEM